MVCRAVALAVLLSLPCAAAPNPAPWRAFDAAGSPEWLRFGLEHRLRYEHLESDFRATARDDSSGLFLRTLLQAELDVSPVTVGAEFQDARAFATDETPLSTALVNPLELLQAHLTLRGKGLLAEGDEASVALGRMTLDLGSRRLVARNEFRNTINAFTGLDASWLGGNGHRARAFAVVPVRRLPAEAEALSQNTPALDRESEDALLWGLFYGSRPLAHALQVEAYLLGLHERDGRGAPSANRRLFTPGVRVLRPIETGRVDFQLELMAQLGTSRASAADTDERDLRHVARSLHATVGRRFDAPGKPRLAFQYDFASGDEAREDDTNGRFDPLFGARRFDFGPTGLYGAFARSNLSSPGLRLELGPDPKVDALAGYRLVWLAAARDAWAPAGLRDATGGAGAFVGHQLEARVRWHALPKNLSLELGGAYLFRGRFAIRVPEAKPAPPLYGYAQLTTWI